MDPGSIDRFFEPGETPENNNQKLHSFDYELLLAVFSINNFSNLLSEAESQHNRWPDLNYNQEYPPEYSNKPNKEEWQCYEESSCYGDNAEQEDVPEFEPLNEVQKIFDRLFEEHSDTIDSLRPWERAEFVDSLYENLLLNWNVHGIWKINLFKEFGDKFAFSDAKREELSKLAEKIILEEFYDGRFFTAETLSELLPRPFLESEKFLEILQTNLIHYLRDARDICFVLETLKNEDFSSAAYDVKLNSEFLVEMKARLLAYLKGTNLRNEEVLSASILLDIHLIYEKTLIVNPVTSEYCTIADYLLDDEFYEQLSVALLLEFNRIHELDSLNLENLLSLLTNSFEDPTKLDERSHAAVEAVKDSAVEFIALYVERLPLYSAQSLKEGIRQLELVQNVIFEGSFPDRELLKGLVIDSVVRIMEDQDLSEYCNLPLSLLDHREVKEVMNSPEVKDAAESKIRDLAESISRLLIEYSKFKPALYYTMKNDPKEGERRRIQDEINLQHDFMQDLRLEFSVGGSVKYPEIPTGILYASNLSAFTRYTKIPDHGVKIVSGLSCFLNLEKLYRYPKLDENKKEVLSLLKKLERVSAVAKLYSHQRDLFSYRAAELRSKLGKTNSHGQRRKLIDPPSPDSLW